MIITPQNQLQTAGRTTKHKQLFYPNNEAPKIITCIAIRRDWPINRNTIIRCLKETHDLNPDVKFLYAIDFAPDEDKSLLRSFGDIIEVGKGKPPRMNLLLQEAANMINGEFVWTVEQDVIMKQEQRIQAEQTFKALSSELAAVELTHVDKCGMITVPTAWNRDTGNGYLWTTTFSATLWRSNVFKNINWYRCRPFMACDVDASSQAIKMGYKFRIIKTQVTHYPAQSHKCTEDCLPPYNMTKDDLVSWLRNAGSANKDYFHTNSTGGLMLHQVPEEFATLLNFYKQSQIRTYLEIGIGEGASFMLSCYFLKRTLKKAMAVDDLSYGQRTSEISSRISLLEQLGIEVDFVKTTANLHNVKYDCVFIDADHSYEAVKKDFIRAITMISKNGYIIFHDIGSKLCPGVKKLWREIKNEKCREIIFGDMCGIGIYRNL